MIQLVLVHALDMGDRRFGCGCCGGGVKDNDNDAGNRTEPPTVCGPADPLSRSLLSPLNSNFCNESSP